MLPAREKGFLLVLNSRFPDAPAGFIVGSTLPTIVLPVSFNDEASYDRALRTDYRRRKNRIRKLFAETSTREGSCGDFTSLHYAQYRDVLARSSGKLETLTEDFFSRLSEQFVLRSFYAGDMLLGWHITLRWRETLSFFLGGINYSMNEKHAVYFNMLFDIIFRGIGSKAGRIDLGQTAEIPKMRTGGRVEPRWMFARHSNPVAGGILKLGKGLLAYSKTFTGQRVFRIDA